MSVVLQQESCTKRKCESEVFLSGFQILCPVLALPNAVINKGHIGYQMTQWVKAWSAKPGDLSLGPGVHLVEGEG